MQTVYIKQMYLVDMPNLCVRGASFIPTMIWSLLSQGAEVVAPSGYILMINIAVSEIQTKSQWHKQTSL